MAVRRTAVAAFGASRAAEIDGRCTAALAHHPGLAAQAASPGRTSRQRLAIALRLVDEFGAVVAPLAACRQGCSHCCHIRVELTQLEAERLGRAIGRKPNTKLRYLPYEDSVFGYDRPCPFLVDRECSIHAHRPFACRKHHSLDADELFCRLDVPPAFSDCVPRVQPNLALLAYGTAMSPSMGLADIRDWFPGPRELARGPIGRIRTVRQALDAAEDKTAPRTPIAVEACSAHAQLRS
jgi:hypothetical protein